MPAAVARLERSEEGLSEDELVVANGLIYSRFRGHFRGITREASPQGQVELVVWAARANGALFRICKFDGRFVALDESSDKIDAADRIEDLLEAVRERYPPMAVL